MPAEPLLEVRRQRRAWVALCLIALFALVALFRSPVWHSTLHPESEKPEHQCLISLLAGGGVEIPPPAAAAPFAPVWIFSLATTSHSFQPTPTPYRFLPGRAPPALRS